MCWRRFRIVSLLDCVNPGIVTKSSDQAAPLTWYVDYFSFLYVYSEKMRPSFLKFYKDTLFVADFTNIYEARKNEDFCRL